MTPSPVGLLTHGLIIPIPGKRASFIPSTPPTASQLVDFLHLLHCGALMAYLSQEEG